MQNKEHLVDFTTFKKTPGEKLIAKEVKRAWKRDMKVFHGDKWKKHSNYPTILKDH